MTESEWPDELEALVAAPESHIVLFENESVRVLRVIVPAGTTEPLHVHPLPSVMIVDEPAQIRYFDGDGSMVFESERREVLTVQPPQWMPPEGPHWLENIDDRDYLAYRMELKQ